PFPSPCVGQASPPPRRSNAPWQQHARLRPFLFRFAVPEGCGTRRIALCLARLEQRNRFVPIHARASRSPARSFSRKVVGLARAARRGVRSLNVTPESALALIRGLAASPALRLGKIPDNAFGVSGMTRAMGRCLPMVNSPLQSRALVNFGMVKGRGFSFLPTAKFAIFRDFTPKSRFQKVR